MMHPKDQAFVDSFKPGSGARALVEEIYVMWADLRAQNAEERARKGQATAEEAEQASRQAAQVMAHIRGERRARIVADARKRHTARRIGF